MAEREPTLADRVAASLLHPEILGVALRNSPLAPAQTRSEERAAGLKATEGGYGFEDPQSQTSYELSPEMWAVLKASMLPLNEQLSLALTMSLRSWPRNIVDRAVASLQNDVAASAGAFFFGVAKGFGDEVWGTLQMILQAFDALAALSDCPLQLLLRTIQHQMQLARGELDPSALEQVLAALVQEVDGLPSRCAEVRDMVLTAIEATKMLGAFMATLIALKAIPVSMYAESAEFVVRVYPEAIETLEMVGTCLVATAQALGGEGIVKKASDIIDNGPELAGVLGRVTGFILYQVAENIITEGMGNFAKVVKAVP